MNNSFFSSLGVPLSATKSGNIIKKIATTKFPVRNRVLTITAEKQRVCFKQMLLQPKSGLCCVYSIDPGYCRQATFKIFKRAIARSFKRKTSLPLWHVVQNDFTDNVSRKDLLQQPSLLVVDNITEKAMPAKTELIRDIIARYQNIPVVLIVTTDNPLRFTNSTLIFPSRFIYLEDRQII